MAKERRGDARSRKDKERAAALKRAGVERTTGRCANCYRVVTVDSAGTRWTHRCRLS